MMFFKIKDELGYEYSINLNLVAYYGPNLKVSLDDHQKLPGTCFVMQDGTFLRSRMNYEDVNNRFGVTMSDAPDF
jgi:hypothetical protein